ncbi:MAG: hypothetical protein RhofKO_08330 [Rhodothermales bacterium]
MVDAELFGLDRAHSYLGFSVGFLGMSTVRGTFNAYDMAVVYNEADMTQTSVALVVKVESIDTASRWRDRDLQGERFFDADQHPYIVFQSDRMEPSDTGWIAHGRLTIRGTTLPLAVPIRRTLERTVDAGWGNVRIGFEGTLTLNRTEFGIHGGDFWGRQALSEEVEVEFGVLGTIMNQQKIVFRSQEKRSIGEELQEVLEAGGMTAAEARFRAVWAEQQDAFNVAEAELNKLGYKLIEHGRIEEAIAIFRLNVEAYPESANVYDSLGQAYAMLGRRAEALAHYTQALERDPYLPSAMEMIRRLNE